MYLYKKLIIIPSSSQVISIPLSIIHEPRSPFLPLALGHASPIHTQSLFLTLYIYIAHVYTYIYIYVYSLLLIVVASVVRVECARHTATFCESFQAPGFT